jgi:hypothetical protein
MSVQYKPGMTLDTPIDITMAAADWLCFMTWLGNANTEGVDHLIYAPEIGISEQIIAKIYDTPSVKAALAQRAQHRGPTSLGQVLEGLGGIHLGRFQVNEHGEIVPVEDIPNPEDFGYGEEDDA